MESWEFPTISCHETPARMLEAGLWLIAVRLFAKGHTTVVGSLHYGRVAL